MSTLSGRPLHFDTLRITDDADGASDVAEPIGWFWTLHGAFGMGRNWAPLMRRVMAHRPRYAAAIPDLREHGKSVGHRPPPHTLAAAADDLNALPQPTAVIGHSFGGKLALQYAATAPATLEQIWVIDSTPAVLDPERGDAWAMIRLLKQMPDVFASREEAVDAMQRRGLSSPVATWMAMNVHRDGDDGYRWRFKLEGIEALALDFYLADLWSVVEDPPHAMQLHFVRASESPMLDSAAVDRLQQLGRDTGRVHVHEVRGGHWLNADNPDALTDLLTAHLPA